ncbi:unnamed protein product [Soboliphyme baturini]|uniref:Transposase n=1 Tax=Soboliphyme baturini TaxID=241478 RepID=A0A183ISL9_9BILA|nr:unnamed protein product [Soboliphyme baturini]
MKRVNSCGIGTVQLWTMTVLSASVYFDRKTVDVDKRSVDRFRSQKYGFNDNPHVRCSNCGTRTRLTTRPVTGVDFLSVPGLYDDSLAVTRFGKV